MRTAIPNQPLGLQIQTMSDVSALEAYSKSNALQRNKKEMQEGRGNLQKRRVKSTQVAGLNQTWCGPTRQRRRVKRARGSESQGNHRRSQHTTGQLDNWKVCTPVLPSPPFTLETESLTEPAAQQILFVSAYTGRSASPSDFSCLCLIPSSTRVIGTCGHIELLCER